MALTCALGTTVVPAVATAGSFHWIRGEGADACATGESVTAQLAAQLQSPPNEALGARSVDAMVSREGDTWVVVLWWRGAQGATSARRELRITDPSCDAAVRAAITSLVVAIQTDGVVANDNAVPRPAVVPPTPPQSQVPTPPASSPSPSPSPAPVSEVRMGDITLGAVAAVGWIPLPAIGVQLVTEPLVYRRLRVVLGTTALVEQTGTFGTALIGVGALEFFAGACGMPLRAGTIFEAGLCANAGAGVNHVFVYRGSPAPGGNSGSFALSGSLLFRGNPVGPLALALEIGLRLPVTRLEIPLSDGSTLSQPGAALVMSLRIGIHLW